MTTNEDNLTLSKLVKIESLRLRARLLWRVASLFQRITVFYYDQASATYKELMQ